MFLFIVNESSGNGRGRKVWAAVEALLRDKGTDYIKVITRSESDAVMRVSWHIKQRTMNAAVIVGGDGTLHALLPLLAGTGIPCGLIPSGSGNDTARALRIPHHPGKALDAILSGATRRIDLLETITPDGKAQLTLTAVAVGLDAAVAKDVNESRYKKWCNKLGIGSLAYVIGLLRTLVHFRPRQISITLDGVSHEFENGWLSAISNVSTYGGGLQICPKATPNDGHLHVCIVHSCSVLHFLLIFPTVLTGRHVKWERYVTILTGRRVTIQTAAATLAYGDGEPAGETPITARIVPHQLDFITAVSG